jgi:hypothetical protein
VREKARPQRHPLHDMRSLGALSSRCNERNFREDKAMILFLSVCLAWQ